MFGGNAANKLIKEDYPSTIPSSHGDNFITYPGLRGDRLIEKDYPYVTNDRLIEKDYDEYMTNDQLMEEAYSRYGKIVECLIESKQNDPIIFIDELDKISETTEGKEIENCFIHLLDSLQNIDFRDKYFSEIPIDLSKVLFIIAFNNINKINPILLDRIHIIKIQDPDTSTKINISKLHLIPKLYKNYSLFENNDTSNSLFLP